jgi:ribosomal protein L16 Arg81 hydroxylase
MHYDIQDNFLFQLTGSKRVTLLSPEAGRIVRPYPSHHPLWRQTSRTNITYDQLVTLFLEQNQSKPQPPDSQSTTLGTSAVAEASKASQGRRRGKEINFAKSENFMLWTVELHAGDLLYIPAGYYHEVETGADSISINTWFPSSYSTFAHRLSKVSLPFVTSDNIDTRLAKIAIIMKEICHLVGEKRSCLVDRMRERYENVFADQERYSKQLESSSGISRQQECLASDALMCNPVSTMKTAGESLPHMI